MNRLLVFFVALPIKIPQEIQIEVVSLAGKFLVALFNGYDPDFLICPTVYQTETTVGFFLGWIKKNLSQL